ncbi:MAG: hypothetical protein DMG13_17595 [Acidobacteria bacterium]|nr:MAG: hypothetical protein DMG13_17595 [Acidobacteriota bacterium]
MEAHPQVFRTSRSWLCRSDELIHQDNSVVADYLAAHGAVVVLVADAAAAASILQIAGEHAVAIPIFTLLYFHDPSARGLLSF